MRKLIFAFIFFTYTVAGQSLLNSGRFGYNPDAVAFINAAGITDPQQKNAINTMVNALQDSGLWSISYAIYPLVGGTATTHKYNLIDPQDTDAAYRIVWSGTVTHNANGITGSANGLGDTKLNSLTVFGTNYAGFHCNVTTGSSGVYMGAGTGNFLWDASGFVNNGAVGGSSVNWPATGMYTVGRIDATNVQTVVNGESYINPVNTFSANPNATFTLLSTNGGFFAACTMNFAAITQNLTVRQSRILNDIVMNFNYYLNRNGNQTAVFTGDSFTFGTGASVDDSTYVNRFCTNQNLIAENLAVGSTCLMETTPTVPQGTLYGSRDSKIKYKNGKRKYLFIAHAINDAGYALTNYTTTLYNTQYTEIINLAKARGWAPSEIFVIAGFYEVGWGTPWGSLNPSPPCDATRYNSFIAEAETVANANGVTFIDMVGIMGAPNVAPDGIHPNDSGYRLIANYLISLF